MKISSLSMSTLMLVCVAGCSSSADTDGNTPPPPVEETLAPMSEDEPSCKPQYSPVVAVHIDYAPWHCEGWTGKVFCEYTSLSSVYGPGWGQCQCYNGCATAKQGRSCRNRRCY